jgi:hypothetical protein
VVCFDPTKARELISPTIPPSKAENLHSQIRRALRPAVGWGYWPEMENVSLKAVGVESALLVRTEAANETPKAMSKIPRIVGPLLTLRSGQGWRLCIAPSLTVFDAGEPSARCLPEPDRRLADRREPVVATPECRRRSLNQSLF